MKTAALLVTVVFWTVSLSVTLATTINLPLNYNFNGIYHGLTEDMGASEISGYRSISDRGIDFSGGVPADLVLDEYFLVSAANTLDMVHLGNRNTVNGGAHDFDATADGDSIGIQPDWLSNPNQTGGAATTSDFAYGYVLSGTSETSFLHHISNGGGSTISTFDVRFEFASGPDFVASLDTGDWTLGTGFATSVLGVAVVDDHISDSSPLKLWEGTIDLGAHSGRNLTSITFENRSSTNSGYGIYAGNLTDATALPEPSRAILVLVSFIAVLSQRRRTRENLLK